MPKEENMKKTILAVTVILASAAICIALIVCNHPLMALIALGIICITTMIVTMFKGLFSIFTWFKGEGD